MQTPLRHAWIDSDLDAVIVAGESTVKAHPNYDAVKAGSTQDAWALVAEIMAMADRSASCPERGMFRSATSSARAARSPTFGATSFPVEESSTERSL